MGDLKHLLENWGADTKAALHSMMDDEEFYTRLLKEFSENTEIEMLNTALEKENYKEAFKYYKSFISAYSTEDEYLQ